MKTKLTRVHKLIKNTKQGEDRILCEFSSDYSLCNLAYVVRITKSPFKTGSCIEFMDNKYWYVKETVEELENRV